MISRSLIIPVYRNAENIPSLIAALKALNASIGGGLEVVLVIDGSPDNSGALLLEAAAHQDFTAKIVFHSRNFGAFTAIRTGMEMATGELIAVMAADLQEPPELIADFFAILAADKADVVFGKREGRHDSLFARAFSAMFWGTYRRYILRDMPKGGVDIFGCNRQVLEAVLSIEEPNSSLVAQLFWVGFRRDFVSYTRRRREHGTSAWSFSRRFRYMMNSIFSFSDLPIMLVLWIGVFGCSISLVLGVITFIARLSGYIHEAGYASLFLLVMFFGSLILSVQGILGCYIWQTAENTKRRPLRLVSQVFASGASGNMERQKP